MKYYSRRMIKHEDLNHISRLFGGTVLSWIDEEAWVYAACQMKTNNIVTKFISEINFMASAQLGDAIEIGLKTVDIGTSSLTIACDVRNKVSKESIVAVDRITFVSINSDGIAVPHNMQKNLEKAS